MAKSHWTKAEPRGCPLIDLVCFYLDDAAQKVIKNKGAPGIDGITYEQLPNLLRVHGGEDQTETQKRYLHSRSR